MPEQDFLRQHPFTEQDSFRGEWLAEHEKLLKLRMKREAEDLFWGTSGREKKKEKIKFKLVKKG